MVYILTKKDSPLVLFSGSKIKEQLNFEVRLNVKGLEYYVFYSTLHFLFFPTSCKVRGPSACSHTNKSGFSNTSFLKENLNILVQVHDVCYLAKDNKQTNKKPVHSNP